MNFKKVIMDRFGGSEVLRLVEEENFPEPRPGEVRVKVLKASANFTDIMIREGKYPDVKEKPPFVPGYDMIGIVDAVGRDVTGWKKGQLVADMTVTGAFSEYIWLPADRLIPVPGNPDPSRAVTLLLSYATAYQMLTRAAKVREGQKILVHGAGGAVGLALLQLGRLMELEVYGTASFPKHDRIRENGAVPVDYRNEDVSERIMELTGDGVDAVFDPIGGASFRRSFSVLRKGGKLVAYGFYNAVTGRGGSIPVDFMRLMLWNLLPNGKKSTFYSIGSWRKKHPDWYKQDVNQLFKWLEEGRIQPVIADHYPLEKVREAQERIERAGLTGKLIIDIA